MKNITQKFSVFAGVVLSAHVCEAAVIVGEGTDAIIRSSVAGATGGGAVTSINPGNTQIRAGNWDAGDGFNFSIVFVFELPDLGMVADPFVSATFDYNLAGYQGGAYNGDLYGIDARATNALVPNDDFWVGDGPDSTATLLQDNLVTPTSSIGLGSSDDISSFLNAQYNGGANIGEYVFLRVNRDGNPAIADERSGYLISTANQTNTALQPQINFTAVPEPSSLLLLSGGMALITLRRRR
ncbi:MAG: PEP-CTERM sorting domain-containing protein [Roseibacillus sp.]